MSHIVSIDLYSAICGITIQGCL